MELSSVVRAQFVVRWYAGRTRAKNHKKTKKQKTKNTRKAFIYTQKSIKHTKVKKGTRGAFIDDAIEICSVLWHAEGNAGTHKITQTQKTH